MYIYRVDDDESLRRGAAGSWQRAHDDELAQEVGAVWRHGGANNRPVKVIALISHEWDAGR